MSDFTLTALDALATRLTMLGVPIDETIKYSPSQPRAPKGTPTGGEWVDDPTAARIEISRAPLVRPTIINQQVRGSLNPRHLHSIIRTIPTPHLRGLQVTLEDTFAGRPHSYGIYTTRGGVPRIHFFGAPQWTDGRPRAVLSPEAQAFVARHEVGHHVQMMNNLGHDPEWRRLTESILTSHDDTFRRVRQDYRESKRDLFYTGREAFATAYAEYMSDRARFESHFPAMAAYLKRKVPGLPVEAQKMVPLAVHQQHYISSAEKDDILQV